MGATAVRPERSAAGAESRAPSLSRARRSRHAAGSWRTLDELGGSGAALACAALCLLAPAAARAHAIDMGGLELKLEDGKLEEQLWLSTISWVRLATVDYDDDGALSPKDLEQALPSMFAGSLGQAPIAVDGKPCTLSPTSAEVEGQGVRLRASGQCPSGRKVKQRLDFTMALPEGHGVVVVAQIGGVRFEKLADRATRTLVFEQEAKHGLLEFVKLGVEHIFTGYDHLLFLLGLLLAGGSLRRLAAIVSAFTVAHSITLALAALSVVHLPSRFVESAIAASIMYVAAEDFFGKDPKHRWAIAFGFGLVHGFGFASVLAEMHLERSGTLLALVGFNLGVEAGQLSLVLVAAPLINVLRRRAWFLKLGVPALSLFALAMGAYWFVQRAFLG